VFSYHLGNDEVDSWVLVDGDGGKLVAEDESTTIKCQMVGYEGTIMWIDEIYLGCGDAGSSNTSSIHTTIDISLEVLEYYIYSHDLHICTSRIFAMAITQPDRLVFHISPYIRKASDDKEIFGTPSHLAPNNSPTIFIDILTRPTFLKPYRPVSLKDFFLFSI
jgi:hypothetical protein